jgi:hypothetical protein
MGLFQYKPGSILFFLAPRSFFGSFQRIDLDRLALKRDLDMRSGVTDAPLPLLARLRKGAAHLSIRTFDDFVTSDAFGNDRLAFSFRVVATFLSCESAFRTGQRCSALHFASSFFFVCFPTPTACNCL